MSFCLKEAHYASAGSVDVTLRDITATLVTANTVEDLKTATTPVDTLNLRYGQNALMDYGAVTGNPYFEVDTDYAGIRVAQDRATYEANKQDLTGTDIRALFTGSTTVVVKNEKTPDTSGTGNLTVSKTVTGNAGDQSKDWNFTVTLKDASGDALTGTYSYTGNGTVTGGANGKVTVGSDGTIAITLKHNQSVTFTGLPAGTTYTVTETEANTDGYTTTATGDTGTITANITSTAAFTNTKNGTNPPDEPDTPPDEPDTPDTPDTPDEPVVPNDPDTPQTGDPGMTGLWALLSALSLGGLFLSWKSRWFYQGKRIRK